MSMKATLLDKFTGGLLLVATLVVIAFMGSRWMSLAVQSETLQSDGIHTLSYEEAQRTGAMQEAAVL